MLNIDKLILPYRRRPVADTTKMDAFDFYGRFEIVKESERDGDDKHWARTIAFSNSILILDNSGIGLVEEL